MLRIARWLSRMLVHLAALFGLAAGATFFFFGVRSHWVADAGYMQYTVRPERPNVAWRIASVSCDTSLGVAEMSVGIARVGEDGLICFPPPAGLRSKWHAEPVTGAPASWTHQISSRAFALKRSFWSYGRDFDADVRLRLPIWVVTLASLMPCVAWMARSRGARRRGFEVQIVGR